jgi:hypothetical protein
LIVDMRRLLMLLGLAVSPPHALGAYRVLAERAWSPRWSPTGAHLAFLREDGLYTMRADGSAQRRVFEGVVHSLDW